MSTPPAKKAPLPAAVQGRTGEEKVAHFSHLSQAERKMGCLYNLGRIFLGLSLLAAGVFNLNAQVPHPELYAEFAEMALFGWYAWLLREVIAPYGVIFAWLLVIYQFTMGLLLLSRGKWVKVGLIGYSAFLMAIVPMIWPYTFMNLILMWIPLALLRREYPRSVLDIFQKSGA